MRKLVISAAVLGLAATSALAQDTWTLDRSGAACSAARAASNGSDPLVVSYDPASQEVTIRTAVESDGAGAATGARQLWVIFDKGRGEELDIAWGYRQFAFERAADRLDLTTRFAGAKNVDQFLKDLASSRRLGLVEDKKTVADFDLAGIGPMIAQLRNCARTVS